MFLNVVLWVLGSVILLLVVLISIYALYLVHKRNQYAHLPGPPITSFFKGHLDEISAVRQEGYPTPHKFLEWHLKYGKLVLAWFWHVPFLIVTDPEMIKDVMVAKNFPKDPFSYELLSQLFGQRFLGSGLGTNVDYENWKQRRGTLNPAFHRKSLKESMCAFNYSANLLLEHLSTKADGETVISIYDMFARAALDVICKVAFGMDLDIIGGKDTKFTDAVSLSFQGVEEATFDILHKIRVSKFPYQQRVVKAIQFLREVGKKVIEKRKTAIHRGEQVPDDILQRIIEQEAKVPGIDMEDLLDDFVSFYIAGHETTSSLLAFSVLELADHPEIEECLLKEVFDVLGNKKQVEFDDLGKLHQLGLVLKETLRLHPPAANLLRKTAKEEVLGGYRIPANVSIMASTYVCSRSPEYWDNPDEFNPYRFDDEEQLKRSHYTYFPFSLGPRNCIGQNFAQIEAKVLLSRFLQTFKFTLVPGQSRDVLQSVTLRPKSGLMCTLTKRN